MRNHLILGAVGALFLGIGGVAAVTGGRGISQQGTFLQSGTGATLRTIESELRDPITPKQFGAVCDGVTDDSTAIQSAVTAAGTSTTTKTVIIWSNCVGSYTQPVNGVRVLDFRRGSGSGPILNSAAVEVRAYATGGAGTVGSPWTGWDTAITWTANTYYFFSTGVYAYSTAPNWALTGIRIVGEFGEPTLQFNGTGNAVVFDGGAAGGGIYDVQLENVTISGNTNATNGIYARAIHHSVFRNIRVKNVSAACFLTQWTVVDTVDTFRCSTNEGANNPIPVNGIYLDQRSSTAEATSAMVFINPILEGMSGSGIKIVSATQNQFLGGTSEANQRGIETGVNGIRNQFLGIDLEANSIEDALINSAWNTFEGTLSAGIFHIGSNGHSNVLTGGLFNTVTIDSGAKLNLINGLTYNTSSGTFTDNGTSTRLNGLYNQTSGKADGIPWTARETIPDIGWSGMGVPDKQDTIYGTYTLTTVATVLSNTALTASAPWRAIFIGAWMNTTDGTALTQVAPYVEVTSAASTITAGSRTVTVSKNGSNQLQAVTDSGTVGFAGRIIVISHAVAGSAGAAGTASLVLQGSVSAGAITGTLGTFNSALTTKRTVLTYSATIATDASLGNSFSITATNGTAFTISNPTNLTTGQRIMYTIRNTSGGAHGAITWGGTFKTAAAALTVTTAFSKSIEFIYDGTNLIETFRSAADVAN